jgi:hypothetical protein
MYVTTTMLLAKRKEKEGFNVFMLGKINEF